MTRTTSISQVEFGQPEAEHDSEAIRLAFYEAAGWKAISADRGIPFVVGRKGSGKSAIAARMEVEAQQSGTCFLRIVPSNFRHVEVRDLLSNLVNKNASWQYIYRKVWEGIIIGQVVRHINTCQGPHSIQRLPRESGSEIARFSRDCAFYVADIGDALSTVLCSYVRDAARKTDALSQVDLRRMLEPYSWQQLVHHLGRDLSASPSHRLTVAIDGLDEHWDNSPASLHFLAELLAVTKNLNAALCGSVRFLVCLRDNIFRALVDTKSIEYDKIESLVINLSWTGQSLFELIARRVSPKRKLDAAVLDLRDMLPDSVDGLPCEQYLARHVLQRPRDYVNFFRMLQRECYPEPRAGVGHLQDTVGKYCANRLIDLDNEFDLTYPRVAKLVEALHTLPQLFPKADLLQELIKLLRKPSFRSTVPELIAHYGQPETLGRILLSIGALGTYDSETHSLRFVHEFSESRVAALWDSTAMMGIHPVYRPTRHEASALPHSQLSHAPAIISHPADYLPERSSATDDLPQIAHKAELLRQDVLSSLAAIDRGQPHSRRFESWVRDTLLTCFPSDLLNVEEQISTSTGNKRFEMVFDIVSQDPPWSEIKGAHKTFRLLVECKNTDEPTDADISKLVRDMQALNFHVSVLAYRGSKREPHGKLLEHLRAAYANSNPKAVIMACSEPFLVQCLSKKSQDKCRSNLNSLWRDHMHRWLAM